MSIDTCVCCGKTIPEGMQVCPDCNQWRPGERITPMEETAGTMRRNENVTDRVEKIRRGKRERALAALEERKREAKGNLIYITENEARTLIGALKELREKTKDAKK